LTRLSACAASQLLQKFVFLAERILSRDESPEGYRYESLRLQKLFNLTTGQWRSMAEEAAVPFYEKALTSAVLEAKPVTAPQLAAVRDSLGISTTCADNMHADIFSKAAAEMLADGALAAADKERLSSVVTLLGMAPAAMSRTLQSLTSPLYTASFEEVLAELEALDADADASFCAQKSAGLAQRQEELLLEAADAHAIEAEAMRTTAIGVLEGAVKLLRAQNVPQGLGEVQRLDAFCARAAAFMVEVEHAQGPPEAALSSLFGGLKSGEMKQSEVLSLYRVLLLHYLEDFKVDEVEAASLARLRAVLGLSDVESTSIYQAAAGPLFRTAVQKAVNAELGEAQKEELQTSLANLALPPEATLAVSAEVYGEKLRAQRALAARTGRHTRTHRTHHTHHTRTHGTRTHTRHTKHASASCRGRSRRSVTPRSPCVHAQAPSPATARSWTRSRWPSSRSCATSSGWRCRTCTRCTRPSARGRIATRCVR
jgi:hypothetical protein